MKPQLSPLLLLDFAIVNSSFKFIAPPDATDVSKLFSDYLLDIDFAIITHAENTRVFIKVAINQTENELPGYSIFAEGVAVFDLDKNATLSVDDKKSLFQYSAVSIALNSLRGFIASLTANAPFGRYIFPSIDVNNLFQQKTTISQKKQPKKARKK